MVDPQSDGPIRGELLGLERLEAQARAFSSTFTLAKPKKQGSPLLRRFEANGKVLVEAHTRIISDPDRVEARGIDAEWLADNFHIVEDTLREVRNDLPPGYDSELPKLAEPPWVGYPRVYALALLLVAHTDSELDENRITRFVEVFQEVAPLTIGELWALPTMFRLVLLENLRRLAEQMMWGWDERRKAERFAAEVLSEGDLNATLMRALPNPSDPFVVRALQLLRDQGTEGSSILDRMETHLEVRKIDPNEALRREHRRQAANQVSVGNCVISLRLVSALDWNTFFEKVSRVEAILRDDPAGVYALQDFATRDRYRRAVEKVARRSSADEQDVARRVIALAREGGGKGDSRGHIGYYLVGDGGNAFKKSFAYKPRGPEKLLTWILEHPRFVYFGSISAVLTLLLVVGLAGVFLLGVAWWMLVLAGLALLLPLSEVAVGVVNHVITLFVPPRVLAKMEFKEGIPVESATFVVMPSMLIRPKSASGLLERLEIHYLANPDPELRFALLTDFADAPAETMPEDEGFIADALDRVKALNQRYAAGKPEKFFLFHRRRLWNPVQNTWMGWERKRGKLSEFNRLIRGDKTTSYSTLSGDPMQLPRIRFVLTLDSDTQMPRDTARRMIGTIAHPLNQPKFDPKVGRVVEGHGVLQPRVSFHLTAATHSRFAGLLASSGGIDPYSSAASDTYMDLFGVGSFTGKGIYDVDAFEAATGHTFPENRILSHDLIEGNYARCGLLSDTELFDDFPARYHAYARREHRWARGDWQLLPWLFGTVPSPDGPKKNPLPALERWKLFDNLRRSLVPPALVLLFILGWTVLPGSPWAWTAVALAVPAVPLLQVIVGTIVGSIRSKSLGGFKVWRDSLPATIGQVGMVVTFLADQARTLVDATVRTLVRLFYSHKNMLEWETAATTDRRLGTGFWNFALSMWPAPAMAVAIAALLALVKASALPAASPVLIAWFLSPLLAFWLSRPRAEVASILTAADVSMLRQIARRTWLFFETFVGDEDNWLPPDNYQEEPDGRVAHRTSPTNQGLLLLSTLSAYDFGFIGLRTLVERLDKTLDTFDRMERHWGHFYNWYDTKTLKPLPPLYISTVDSGNLLGSLVALHQGLMEVCDAPFFPVAKVGLGDTLEMVREAASAVTLPIADVAHSTHRLLMEDIQKIDRELAGEPEDLLARDEWLGRLDWSAVGMVGRVKSLQEIIIDLPPSVESWARRFAGEISSRRAELDAMAPWLSALKDVQAGSLDADSAAKWAAVRAKLIAPAALSRMMKDLDGITEQLKALPIAGLDKIAEAVAKSRIKETHDRLHDLAGRSENLASAMEFEHLYKADRNLYSIGCNLTQGRLDGACYDLLASESCLTSFLTIARGDAPRRHWFHLGRPFIEAAGRVGLMSWGGTMFEYLMPRLLMRGLPGTLVAEANRTAVARQIEYGVQTGVPWGISESAFNAQYVDGDYQYQSFGVPGLGLKRGLEKDHVVAPYATALATMIAPHEAVENFRKLAADGALGPYGYYEAVDFTRNRVPKGKKCVVVKQYMAHHQGMSLVGLANALLDEPMPRRFHAVPMVRAVDLLLQERIPRDATIIEPSEVVVPSQTASEGVKSTPPTNRRLTTAATPAPRVHLLSNTQYHVMITNAGGGYSTCRGLDVTRWREDITRDNWGQFLYLRDISTGIVWSSAHQPTCRLATTYEVVFSSDKAAFRRRDGMIETLTEITVSPEGMAEVRRVTLTNHDTKPHEVEVTSYAEVVLLGRGADIAHPAFGKLFVETEWLSGSHALLCRRRPRASDQAPIWAVHVLASENSLSNDVQFETDRARFLGRGRSAADPAALDPGVVLSGTTGPVLDPIASLRKKVKIEPAGSTVIAFTTAVADTREEALAIADHYRQPTAAARAFEVSWAHSQVEHRQKSWSAEDVHLYQRLASHILFAGSAMRADPPVIAANRLDQTALWRHGVSGDFPIVLARINDASEMTLGRELLAAYTYLRSKGLEFDLLLLDEEATSYNHELHRTLQELVRNSDAHDMMSKPGGVFVLKSSHADDDDRVLLQAAARVVFVGERGSMATQLDRTERLPVMPAPMVPSPPASYVDADKTVPDDLLFANGFGGFSPDGSEYVILVRNQSPPDVRRNGKSHAEPTPHPVLPPAPWVNVIANPVTGVLASESGVGYTWSVNSQANRLTPWSNDPVVDPPAAIVYFRDESTGQFWTPTPRTVPATATTLVRHGQGYTTYERNSHGLHHEMTVFVPPDDPVLLLIVKIRNLGDKSRKLSATFYADWVLGTNRDSTSMHVVTDLDADTGALIATNHFRTDFGNRVAFADTDRRPRSLTGDRGAFLGRNGSAANPASMKRAELSGRVGAALDPCAAIQTPFEIVGNGEIELVFFLGETEDLATAQSLVRRYREPGRAASALEEVRQRWKKLLTTVQIRTPNPAMDVLVNRWLPYQVLSCRVWGRSALYQSGGAYGFRDQLQDVMALVALSPEETRNQILRAGSRQFLEGDVQHWWHPPTGRGVRTRISDDFLWLPYVALYYVSTTGDDALFDELVPYLKAPVLKVGQEEDYGLPAVADEKQSIYEHCVKSLERSVPRGVHGLPLMGTGDWNDGMNRVGSEGKGESVWVAWFLLTILPKFGELARKRGDSARSDWCRNQVDQLRDAIDKNGWDGVWYRRAYFDDGTPLGSSSNDECQIDSIAQTWAVLSEQADPQKASMAMDSVEERLVKREDKVILLFDPPFDHGNLHPGYIKGYVPGIRENGGQYSHAAVWAVSAEAKLGRGGKAVELFDLLNPILHGNSPEAVAKYKVEPYVMAGDVYGRPPQVGRGGWTWYTGSASWLYRAAVESILGFQLRGNRLFIEPCVPQGWTEWELIYRFRTSTYKISVRNPDGVERGVREIAIDGEPAATKHIPLEDDGREHLVHVIMG